MLTICRSSAIRTQHSPPNFCRRGWQTTLHALKAGRQAIGFVSTRRRPSSYGFGRLEVGSSAQWTPWSCPAPPSSRLKLSEILESSSTAICRWLPTSATSPACAFSISASCDSSVVHSRWILHRAFIHSRLDYCNALFAGFAVSQLTRLTVCSKNSRSSCTRAAVSAATHNSLHWLSYPQRVTYKLCLLTYKCLQGRAAVYLSRLCVLTASVSGRSRLRSADDNQLLVPRTQSVTLIFDPRAFTTSGSDAWNTTVVWAASFIFVSGLFQTFTQDFSAQFVDLVFLSSRGSVWRLSLTVRF